MSRASRLAEVLRDRQARSAHADGRRFVDRLAREGPSRSGIVNRLRVVRAICCWACRPTSRLVAANPTIGVELRPVDEVADDRVATAEESALKTIIGR